SEGEAALAAIARHEARFPEGQLAAERESIRVRALLLLGRNDEARWAAERFRAEYPESIFMGVVERAAPR
ncbi:MAG: sigma-70 family RNA polymerase sigma factor, partial [Sandaracinaceae bacterium]|nr:sigma-70 family RNA polymerase sigma factor [Sandaracinaceae bacterium]